MTLLEAKSAARRLFRVPLTLSHERSWKVISVAQDCASPFPGACKEFSAGTELGRGGSWLEAMRNAALKWTQSVSEEHLREKVAVESERREAARAKPLFGRPTLLDVMDAGEEVSGRSSDQPGLIPPASLGAAPGPASNPEGGDADS